MPEYSNYEDLKSSTKTIIQVITSDNLYYGLFLLVVLIVGLKLIDVIFHPLKKRGSILVSFLKGCLKAFLAITIGMKICSLSQVLAGFASQILMSSSLIVVVLGFVFQEGLSNIVHGFILSTFKPFHIGDRVQISVDGERITGYIQSIDLRSTMIRNVVNSSCVIVPNSKMDLCVIENSYFDSTTDSSSFLDLSVTYQSNLDKAIGVMVEEISAHPYVQEVWKSREKQTPVEVIVRNLSENGVELRATVITKTVEQNFAACSDIRRRIFYRFTNEADIHFAHNAVSLYDEIEE